MRLRGQAASINHAVYRRDNLAQISFPPAVWGFTQLFFGRIPYKFWGLSLLIVSLFLISYSNVTNPVNIQPGTVQLKTFSLPTAVRTQASPLAKQVKEAKIIEEQASIQTIPKIPTGVPSYNRKLKVFATSYDKNCPGCSGTTASGLPTGYGVVAVDPKVIPLGTKLFIPGYGEAVAGDTGGSIKGNRIDLGFDSVKNGWWSSRFVEIYILK